MDQLTKVLVRSSLALGQSRPVLGDLLKITYWENPGAAFGLLPGAIHFFVLTSVVSIAGSMFIYAKYRPFGLPGALALGLISGGALGNLIDRLLHGTVTDFINFKYFAPVFNLADSAIVLGAFLVAILILFFSRGSVKE